MDSHSSSHCQDHDLSKIKMNLLVLLLAYYIYYNNYCSSIIIFFDETVKENDKSSSWANITATSWNLSHVRCFYGARKPQEAFTRLRFPLGNSGATPFPLFWREFTFTLASVTIWEKNCRKYFYIYRSYFFERVVLKS